MALGALCWRFGVPAWRGEVRHVVCFSVVVHMLGVLVLWKKREESHTMKKPRNRGDVFLQLCVKRL